MNMKLFHIFSLLPLFFLCFYAIEAAVGPLQMTHPLDPLTQQEITLVQTIVLKKYPKPANRVFFHYIGLDDPDKAVVLKWLSSGARTPRNAFAIAIINNQIHELTVNLLSPRNVASDKIHTGNGFPTLTGEEQTEALELLPKYGPYVESLKKRGFNVSQVACSTFSIGWFGETKSIRAVKLECFSQDGSPNIYVRPISGLTIVADLDKMKIVEYHDELIKPVPTAENTEYRASHLKPPFGPKLHSWSSHQPDGPGYTLNGHSISWANWKFHIGFDERAGAVISTASIYDPELHKSRQVLYRGYISELFVPYQDPTEEWYYKTFFDAGEFAFGKSMVSLVPLEDCPPHAQFLDAYYAATDGSPQHLENAICVFEQYGGVSWRHTETGLDEIFTEVRTDVSLIVRSIVTVGNYDNIVDWEFKTSGSIKPSGFIKQLN